MTPFFPTWNPLLASRPQANEQPTPRLDQNTWRHLLRQAKLFESQGHPEKALPLYEKLLEIPALPREDRAQISKRISSLKGQGDIANKIELLGHGLITELTRPGAWIGTAIAPWAKMAGRFGAQRLLLKMPSAWQSVLGTQGRRLVDRGAGFAAELVGFSSADHGIQQFLAKDDPMAAQALSWSGAAWMMGGMKLMTRASMRLHRNLHGFTVTGEATRLKHWVGLSNKIFPELGGVSGAWLGYQLSSYSAGGEFRSGWEALIHAAPLHLQGKLMGAAMSRIPAHWRRLDPQLDAKFRGVEPNSGVFGLAIKPAHVYYQPPTRSDLHAFPPYLQKAILDFQRTPSLGTKNTLVTQMSRYLGSKGVRHSIDYRTESIVIQPLTSKKMRGHHWLSRMATSLHKSGHQIRFNLLDLQLNRAIYELGSHISLPWTDLSRSGASSVTLHELRHLNNFTRLPSLQTLRLVPNAEVPQLKMYGTRSGHSLDEFRTYTFEANTQLQTARRLLRELQGAPAGESRSRATELHSLLGNAQDAMLYASVLSRYAQSNLAPFLGHGVKTSSFRVPNDSLQGRLFYLDPATLPKNTPTVTLVDFNSGRSNPPRNDAEALEQLRQQIPLTLREIESTQTDLLRIREGFIGIHSALEGLAKSRGVR